MSDHKDIETVGSDARSLPPSPQSSAKGPMDWQHHPGVVLMDLPPSGGKHPTANAGTITSCSNQGYPMECAFHGKFTPKKRDMMDWGIHISGKLQVSWDSDSSVLLVASANMI